MFTVFLSEIGVVVVPSPYCRCASLTRPPTSGEVRLPGPSGIREWKSIVDPYTDHKIKSKAQHIYTRRGIVCSVMTAHFLGHEDIHVQPSGLCCLFPRLVHILTKEPVDFSTHVHSIDHLNNASTCSSGTNPGRASSVGSSLNTSPGLNFNDSRRSGIFLLFSCYASRSCTGPACLLRFAVIFSDRSRLSCFLLRRLSCRAGTLFFLSEPGFTLKKKGNKAEL